MGRIFRPPVADRRDRGPQVVSVEPMSTSYDECQEEGFADILAAGPRLAIVPAESTAASCRGLKLDAHCIDDMLTTPTSAGVGSATWASCRRPLLQPLPTARHLFSDR